jgi:hypothetical protein
MDGDRSYEATKLEGAGFTFGGAAFLPNERMTVNSLREESVGVTPTFV